MALTPQDVRRLAELARIDLSDEELTRLVPQLDVILDSVARVSQVAGDDIVPTSHAIAMTNVFREDQVVPSMDAEPVLAAAPARSQDRFRVPRILDEGMAS